MTVEALHFILCLFRVFKLRNLIPLCLLVLFHRHGFFFYFLRQTGSYFEEQITFWIFWMLFLVNGFRLNIFWKNNIGAIVFFLLLLLHHIGTTRYQIVTLIVMLLDSLVKCQLAYLFIKYICPIKFN